MKVISKDKPKGKEYSINKKMKKAKRLEEEKKFKRITENKRKNAENRKERRLEQEEIDKIREIEIVDYQKGMLHIKINEKIEKRALNSQDKNLDIKNIDNFEINLSGKMWKISILKNYDDIKELLIWKMSE